MIGLSSFWVQGDKGDIGPRGFPGPKGEMGLPGYVVSDPNNPSILSQYVYCVVRTIH